MTFENPPETTGSSIPSHITEYCPFPKAEAAPVIGYCGNMIVLHSFQKHTAVHNEPLLALGKPSFKYDPNFVRKKNSENGDFPPLLCL